MSKLDRDLLDASIDALLKFSAGESIIHPGSANQRAKLAEEKAGKGRNYDHETGMVQGKKRNFLETVELQAALKGYDPSKDKRFNGTMKLPNPAKGALKVCLLGTEKDVEKAREAGIDAMTEDDLKKLNKNKKLVKKLAAKYDAFIASAKLIKKIPRLLGPGLNRAGKFPTVVSPTADLTATVRELSSQIKFQMKKVLCLNAAVGNVTMSADDLRTNIMIATNFLVSLCKKNWQNIGVLYVKSSMGPRFQIYF
jgi:large subunit ribosomal protein L10Ae